MRNLIWRRDGKLRLNRTSVDLRSLGLPKGERADE